MLKRLSLMGSLTNWNLALIVADGCPASTSHSYLFIYLDMYYSELSFYPGFNESTDCSFFVGRWEWVDNAD